MKKLLLIICAALFLSNNASSQSVTTVIGSSPFQDSLWVLDTSNYIVTRRLAPTLAGFTVTGMNGMAKNPISGTIYTIAKVSGVSGRLLCTYNPLTGILTQVGNLGDNFSSITFKHDGTLFGVTGDGASVPETLYQIDTATGTKTLLAALGAGADGEVICYNSTDSMIYHWSGNGTVVFEKVMSVAPYTATNIPIVGTTNGETFGAVHLGGNRFLNSNISSSFDHWDGNGNVSASFGSNPDDLRGLVLYTCPRTITGTLSFCAGDSTKLTMAASATYQWYFNSNLIPGATSQNYYATAAWTYD